MYHVGLSARVYLHAYLLLRMKCQSFAIFELQLSGLCDCQVGVVGLLRLSKCDSRNSTVGILRLLD